LTSTNIKLDGLHGGLVIHAWVGCIMARVRRDT